MLVLESEVGVTPSVVSYRLNLAVVCVVFRLRELARLCMQCRVVSMPVVCVRFRVFRLLRCLS